MRERAEAAGHLPSPWSIGEWHDGWTIEYATERPLAGLVAKCADYVPDGAASHIASWHPATALAVADLLDGEAAHFQHNYPPQRAHRDDELDTGLRRALAVARAYLGESA